MDKNLIWMIGITGATGVLGKIISNKLTEKKIFFSAFVGDIRDENSVKNWFFENKLTYIIHLASKVAVSEVDNNIDEAYDINISGTINLIKAIQQQGLPIGFFYASTSHVYNSSSLPLKESDTIKPINSYGLTKWISEILLNDFQNKYKGLDLCIGRIFSFYHSSQQPPFLYPNLIKRFENEDLTQPFKLFGAYSTRDFMNAEEVCNIIVSLVNKRYLGTVNIASGKSTRIIDFVRNIAPVTLNFDVDENEKVNHLNADISLLKKIINDNE